MGGVPLQWRAQVFFQGPQTLRRANIVEPLLSRQARQLPPVDQARKHDTPASMYSSAGSPAAVLS